MAENSSDSGYELVLDNRRLIIAFAVLVLICGCFFLVGFMEGKRQGYQAGAQTASEAASKPFREESLPQDSNPAAAEPGSKPAKEDAEAQQLNWYKNVSGQGEKPGITPPAPPDQSSRKASTETLPAKTTAKPPAASPPAAPSSYTVQVGAFRHKDQADAEAKMLRAKGFECRIEAPQSPDALYLLKVGKYRSRADAAAMKLRLEQNGFRAFIKTN
jgi:cell division protein FtsN